MKTLNQIAKELFLSVSFGAAFIGAVLACASDAQARLKPCNIDATHCPQGNVAGCKPGGIGVLCDLTATGGNNGCSCDEMESRGVKTCNCKITP